MLSAFGDFSALAGRRSGQDCVDSCVSRLTDGVHQYKHKDILVGCPGPAIVTLGRARAL